MTQEYPTTVLCYGLGKNSQNQQLLDILACKRAWLNTIIRYVIYGIRDGTLRWKGNRYLAIIVSWILASVPGAWAFLLCKTEACKCDLGTNLIIISQDSGWYILILTISPSRIILIGLGWVDSDRSYSSWTSCLFGGCLARWLRPLMLAESRVWRGAGSLLLSHHPGCFV